MFRTGRKPSRTCGAVAAGLLLGVLLVAVVVADPPSASGDRTRQQPGPVPVAAPASAAPGTVTFEVLPRPTPPPTGTPTAPPTGQPTAKPTPTGHLPVTEGAAPPTWLPLLGLLLLLVGTLAIVVARRRPDRR